MLSIGDPVEHRAGRRKVRKGTRSCWECKRRKIRCIFTSPEDAACAPCQRRRAPCVSQEMPEDLSPAKRGNRHLGDRIARVEDLMKGFLEGSVSLDVPSPLLSGSTPSSAQPRGPLTPADSHTSSAPDSLRSRSTSGSEQSEAEAEALHHLLAAFPCEQDGQILLRGSATAARYTLYQNTQPHSKMTREALTAPYTLGQLPGPATHPVLVAQQMLLFARALQGPSGENITGLSEPHSAIFRRLMRTATSWVTSNPEFHGSVEGLICIMVEAVLELNGCNLRRAWAAYRRAMAVAQLMGLHRSPVPPLKRIDPATDVDPEFMWFRIVFMDRYLSLLLGLPQGNSDRSMIDAPKMRDEPPVARFERQLTVIASRLLERNEGAFDASTLATTQALDQELLKASNSMPASFWRPVDFHALKPGLGRADTLLETIRLSAQVYYYGLLIHLHLPYMMMMHSANTTATTSTTTTTTTLPHARHEYSKLTCASASREIMARFIAHRSFNHTSSCSRPVDFFLLLAAMTLLLAHLDSHSHSHSHHHQTNVLAHQRLSDLATLAQALERMEAISNVNADVMSERSAQLIRRLLEIEGRAAEGGGYTTQTVEGGVEGVGVDAGQAGEDRDELMMHIPYLGTVKIAYQGCPISLASHHQPVQSGAQWGPSPPQTDGLGQQELPSQMYDAMGQVPVADPGVGGAGVPPLEPHVVAGVEDWAFQGVDMAFFDSLMRGTLCTDGLE